MDMICEKSRKNIVLIIYRQLYYLALGCRILNTNISIYNPKFRCSFDAPVALSFNEINAVIYKSKRVLMAGCLLYKNGLERKMV